MVQTPSQREAEPFHTATLPAQPCPAEPLCAALPQHPAGPREALVALTHPPASSRGIFHTWPAHYCCFTSSMFWTLLVDKDPFFQGPCSWGEARGPLAAQPLGVGHAFVRGLLSKIACSAPGTSLTTPSSWLCPPVLHWTPTRQLGDHKGDHRAGQTLVPQNNQKANCREGVGQKEEQAFWSAAIHPKALQRCKRNGSAPTLPPNNSMSVFVASQKAFFFFNFMREGR